MKNYEQLLLSCGVGVFLMYTHLCYPRLYIDYIDKDYAYHFCIIMAFMSKTVLKPNKHKFERHFMRFHCATAFAKFIICYFMYYFPGSLNIQAIKDNLFFILFLQAIAFIIPYEILLKIQNNTFCATLINMMDIMTCSGTVIRVYNHTVKENIWFQKQNLQSENIIHDQQVNFMVDDFTNYIIYFLTIAFLGQTGSTVNMLDLGFRAGDYSAMKKRWPRSAYRATICWSYGAACFALINTQYFQKTVIDFLKNYLYVPYMYIEKSQNSYLPYQVQFEQNRNAFMDLFSFGSEREKQEYLMYFFWIAYFIILEAVLMERGGWQVQNLPNFISGVRGPRLGGLYHFLRKFKSFGGNSQESMENIKKKSLKLNNLSEKQVERELVNMFSNNINNDAQKKKSHPSQKSEKSLKFENRKQKIKTT